VERVDLGGTGVEWMQWSARSEAGVGGGAVMMGKYEETAVSWVR
jgi:hypothetical protein